MNKYNFTINRQNIITIDGLHYEQVWEIVGFDYNYDTRYDNYDSTILISYYNGYSLKWSPLKGPMAGVRGENGDRLVAVTTNVQQAIECGFLKLVAPLKR